MTREGYCVDVFIVEYIGRHLGSRNATYISFRAMTTMIIERREFQWMGIALTLTNPRAYNQRN